MKKFKQIFLTVLLILFLIPQTACGGGDGDGGAAPEGDSNPVSDLELIRGGEAKFQIVLSADTPRNARNAVNLVRAKMKNEHGVDFKVVIENSENDVPEDVEILIGEVESRGEEYRFDPYSLGKEGYSLKIVGTKLLINAGSDEVLVDLIDAFAKEILGLENDSVTDVTVEVGDMKEYIQNDYKINSVSINGADVKGYKIIADLNDEGYKAAAIMLQDMLYSYAGYRLEIVDSATGAEKGIELRSVPKIYGEESFKVHADGNKLFIDCAFGNMLESAATSFATEKIRFGTGDLNFSGTVYTRDISVVYYDDFGAKGDGVTDDYEAIFLTHNFANECGQTVKATSGKTYYISNTLFEFNGKTHVQTAVIKTNVDWSGAKFIVDDRNLSPITGSDTYAMAKGNIFTVRPNDEHTMIKLTDKTVLDKLVADGINPSTTKIKLEIEDWDGPLMIIPYNYSHKVYRRRGYVPNTGGYMHEVIVLDKDGVVSEETPIMFDYTDLEYVEVYKLDESSAITICGGEFTTRVSQANLYYETDTGVGAAHTAFMYRGFDIRRSFTTLKDVKHYITDEMTLSEQVDSEGNIVGCGALYYGFFYPQTANHVTLDGCVLTGRRCFRKPVGGTDGTYDFYANNVNKLVLKDCVQSNFWVTLDENKNITASPRDAEGALTSMSHVNVSGTNLQLHWGVGGTNFCKNLEYIGSTLSRFDAHAGLYNGKIQDSVINYIELTGNGKFIMENVEFFSAAPSFGANAIVALRGDYGATWDGEIIVKDYTAHMYTKGTNYEGIFMAYYNHVNWYFGYTCAFPSISLDNITLYDIETGELLPPGTEMQVARKSGINKNSRQHLLTSHTKALFVLQDEDGDGYVDEPRMDRNLDGIIDPPCDLDEDGRVGNTSILYAEAEAQYGASAKSGIEHPTSYVNMNITKPPRYIKVLNNNRGYKYVVTNTAGNGISDGKHYDDVDNNGGFFGDTKFIYGNGADDYFVGTDHETQTKTDVFLFK